VTFESDNKQFVNGLLNGVVTFVKSQVRTILLPDLLWGDKRTCHTARLCWTVWCMQCTLNSL